MTEDTPNLQVNTENEDALDRRSDSCPPTPVLDHVRIRVLSCPWIYPHPATFCKNFEPSPSDDYQGLQREDTLVVSEHPEEEPTPIAEIMAVYGIKVRDFAYECVLPPIPPVRRPRPMQTGPRPLKRSRPEEADNDVFTGNGVLQPSAELATAEAKATPSKLTEKRQSPEPPQKRAVTPTRATNLGPLSQRAQNNSPGPSQPPRTPPRRTRTPLHRGQPLQRSPAFHEDLFSQASQSQSQYYSQSQPPLIVDSQPLSQDTDSQSLVTPYSSQMIVTETSDVPASQLDRESQLPVPEDISYSQLGLRISPDSQPDSQMSSPPRTRDSPLPSLRSMRSGSPSPSIKRALGGKNMRTPFRTPSAVPTSNGRPSGSKKPNTQASTPSPDTTSSPPPAASSPNDTPAPSSPPPPRYYLRKRPNSPDVTVPEGIAPSGPIIRPGRRARSRSTSNANGKANGAGAQTNGTSGPARPRRISSTISRQSAHAKSPIKASKDTPSARPLKKQKV